MQANYRGDHFIAPLLQRLGLCAPGQFPVLESAKEAVESATAPGTPAPATGASAAVRPARIKSLIKRLAPGFVTNHLRRRFGPASRIDWTRTRVFHLPTDRNSYLRVNLRGRELAGIVAPGREYNELPATLENEFRALVNVDTGKAAVEDVFKPHELYPGPRLEDLPDLVVLWSADVPINCIESARIGRLTLRAHEDRSGNHRAEGFILARGPGIRPQGTDLQGDILQVPATLLALHGVAIPARFETSPIPGLLTQAVTPPGRAHPQGPHVPARPAEPALSP
jgi:hypothetical protein